MPDPLLAGCRLRREALVLDASAAIGQPEVLGPDERLEAGIEGFVVAARMDRALLPVAQPALDERDDDGIGFLGHQSPTYRILQEEADDC